MRSKTAGLPDISADPFHERALPVSRTRMHLLGGAFEFECGSSELRRLVDWAYADLPRHKLSEVPPRIRVRVALAPRARKRPEDDPPRIETLSGAGLLCGTTSSSDFAVVSGDYRSALVVVSRDMLRFPYHTRYELIEFAVFTLAARAQGLMPLHGACVGHDGRGLLLFGDSGAGKSTASLHCLLRGMEFVAEDSVLVTPDTMLATGVANFLHIRCDSLHSLPTSSASLIRRSPIIRRRSGVEKFEVDLRRPQFRLAASPLKVTGVVFISAQPARRGVLLTPLRSHETLARFKKSQPYAVNQPGWTTFRKRIAAAPAFELRRGRHPAEAAEALQGLQGLLADADLPKR
jgi:hypothetical protein